MQTLLAALYKHAESTPSRPAILFAKKGLWTQLSYADLKQETERWASIWLHHSPAKEGVAFIIMPHNINMYSAFLGAMRAGLTPSFLPYPTPKQDPELYWQGHKALFARVKPVCVLAYTDILPWLEEIKDSADCKILDIVDIGGQQGEMAMPPQPDLVDPHQVSLLQHSSGTTGLKKGVVLTYRQIHGQIESCKRALGITQEDRIISWLPLYHDMGLVTAFLMPISLGLMVISIDAFEWLMRPDFLLEEIARYKATLCWLPNFAFNHLVRTRDPDKTYDLSSVRAFIDCSEPCKPETVENFWKIFVEHGLKANAVQTCYGMAEIVFAATHSDIKSPPRVLHVDRSRFNAKGEVVPVESDYHDKLSLLSCGKAIDGVWLRIVPRQEERRGTGFTQALASLGFTKPQQTGVRVGEIQVTGPFLFNGYFQNPKADEAAFDGEWFRSGDIGFIHEGELYVCGRLKEMLIIHGRNYYANDIEEIVNQVEGIKPGRVVAVSVYDPNSGSEEAMLLAETVLDDGGDVQVLAETIRKHVFSALSLSLRRVEIMPPGTLVKTTSGKISREDNVKRLGTGVLAS